MDLTEVILKDGKRVSLSAELEMNALDYRFGRFPIADRTPVSLVIENRGSRKLWISASVWLEVLIPCARCLKPVKHGLTIQFDYETDLDETEYIDGCNLDVDQLIHDEALLVWPERVVCREDCKGLCDMCGHNLNDGPCGCERTPTDPRMAKILDIFNNFKEV